jgi:Domain of unknown function (DUF4303)
VPASFDAGAFRRELTQRAANAVQAIRHKVGTEHFYVFALYTSGPSHFAWVRASANTEEALTRSAAQMAALDIRYRGEAGRRLLRWSPPHFEHHDFDPAVAALELPDLAQRTPPIDKAVYEAMVGALRTLDRAGLFGKGAERCFVTVNVIGEHGGEAFFKKGLRRLNSRPAVDRLLHEHSGPAFVRCINRAPRRERMRIWLALFEDLYMEWKTPIAEEARSRGLSPWDVEAELLRFGSRLAPALIDLVSAYGFAPAFDKSRELETREVWLAGSALFMLPKLGAVPEKEIRRLQELVARFAERDRRLRVASTLAENTARILHELRPRRFPVSEMDPATYKLLNPEPFLPAR